MADEEAVMKIELLMSKAGVTTEIRGVVKAALERAEKTEMPAAAIELPDGTIVTGKTLSEVGVPQRLLSNPGRAVGDMHNKNMLTPPCVTAHIKLLRTCYWGMHIPRLHTDEILIALSICATMNPVAGLALKQLSKLKGCEVHSSVILSSVDESIFRKLGMHLTCEPRTQTKKLYHKP